MQVTSHTLYQTYGRQFIKLVRFLHDDFLPRVIAVSPDGAADSSVTRLSGFLQDLLRTGRTQPPPGFLPPSFWTSRD